VADSVHAAVHTVKSVPGHAAVDRTAPEPDRQELGASDNAVLPLGEASDRMILPPPRLHNVTRNRERGVVCPH
jgi:hypothetical protein